MLIKKWYAVYTRPRWEKRVSERLTDNGITSYCPLNRVMRQWHDRKKMVTQPLFTSYVFVKVDVKEQLSVLQTVGVINFVNWFGHPAVIRDEEIELIQKFLKEHKNVDIDGSMFKINDEVFISAGPLISQRGKIVEVRKNTVKLFLPSLRIALHAEVDKSDIVKA